jgi:ABC-type uncharacterized transport system involved in gliding motility auxiliary subunit
MKATQASPFLKIGSSLLGLLALLGILIAVNVIIGNMRLRADFTDEKLYSLSEGTVNALKALEQPVTLKLFFNSSNPKVPAGIKNYASQVEDLLEEYRLAAKHKVKIQKLDPKPDSDAEEWAQKYGIAGQPLEMFGPPIYLGLVATSGKTEAVLPTLDPRMQQLLEFHITRMIHRVTHPAKPVVGVLSSLPIMGTPGPRFAMPGQPQPPAQPAWIAIQELRGDYDLREIQSADDGIPSDIQALLVVHPKELSDDALFAIDQFVLRGGHLVMFVDPMSVADQGAAPSPYGMPQTSSDAQKLLSAWGVGYDASKVLADYAGATPMRSPNGGVERNPTVVSFNKASLDSGDIITTQLNVLRAAFGGALVDDTDDSIDVTALLTASDQCGFVDAMSARYGNNAIRSQFKPSPTPQHLALKLTGTFKTAFPDGKPKADSTEEAEERDETVTAGALSEGKSVVIVVADVDMLYDPLCVEEITFFGQTAHRPLNDNLTFFANMIETMAGSSDLISIRSRGTFHRPFTKVDELEAAAVSKWREQEATLESSLQDAQRQLNELQAQKDDQQRFILSDQQRKAIESFRKQEFDIKRQLKDVRKNLRRDIEALGIRVKVINIALMPLLVALAGIIYGIRRRNNG